MKIEKLSDSQIRCTLTRADLAIRQLKLSELAYGTAKAKSLFHDMMKQAASEFGFEAEDIPLMIEAIPASSGSIVLIITKVEDPDELDTRFSKFSPSDDLNKRIDLPLDKLEGADEFLELLNAVKETVNDLDPPTKDNGKDKKSSIDEETIRIRLFSFNSLDGVINASYLLENIFDGANTLYKDTSNELYILALTQSGHTTIEFTRICNMLSEYGSLERATCVTIAYLDEHCEIMIPCNAVQHLKTI